VVGYWLWDPKTQPKGNLQVSLGGKAPSGDYQADDTFFQDQDPTAGVNIQPVRRNVDQSIQPGDGGWGVSWELNGYRELTKGFFAYAQAYYLFNPQNVNGVKSPTARSDAGPTIAGKNIDNGMSITDQYMFRAGFSKVVSEKHNLSMAAGGAHRFPAPMELDFRQPVRPPSPTNLEHAMTAASASGRARDMRARIYRRLGIVRCKRTNRLARDPDSSWTSHAGLDRRVLWAET
jgi:hypothetical protein